MEHDPIWMMAAAAVKDNGVAWFGQQAKVGHLILTAVLVTAGIITVILGQAERITRLEDAQRESEKRGVLLRDRVGVVEQRQQAHELEGARVEERMRSEHKAIMDALAAQPRASANVTVKR